VTEAPDEQGTRLRVERELPEVHLAAGLDGQPLRVGDPAVGSDPDEPVGHRHLVQVRVLPIQEERVRPPDLRDELVVHGQLDESGIHFKVSVLPFRQRGGLFSLLNRKTISLFLDLYLNDHRSLFYSIVYFCNFLQLHQPIANNIALVSIAKKYARFLSWTNFDFNV
jgi:hypothetical protein